MVIRSMLEEYISKGMSNFMAKTGADFILYITQRVMSYIDTPVEERRERKRKQKQRLKQSWQTRWFGLIPFGMKMWIGKRRYTNKR